MLGSSCAINVKLEVEVVDPRFDVLLDSEGFEGVQNVLELEYAALTFDVVLDKECFEAVPNKLKVEVEDVDVAPTFDAVLVDKGFERVSNEPKVEVEFDDPALDFVLKSNLKDGNSFPSVFNFIGFC